MTKLLSDNELAQIARACVLAITEMGDDLDHWLPINPVDRARFLTLLSKICWQPDHLPRIAKAHKYSQQVKPLILLATQYLYTNQDLTWTVKGHTMPLVRDRAIEFDPFVQTLEWLASEIYTEDLLFFTPQSDLRLRQVDLPCSTLDIPGHLMQPVQQMTEKVLAEINGKCPEIPLKHLRLLMPTDSLLYFIGIAYIRVAMEDDGWWVGLEAETGFTYCSCYWTPAQNFPDGWVADAISPKVRLILHLYLMCIYLDLCTVGLQGLVGAEPDPRQPNIKYVVWSDQADKSSPGRSTLAFIEQLFNIR